MVRAGGTGGGGGAGGERRPLGAPKSCRDQTTVASGQRAWPLPLGGTPTTQTASPTTDNSDRHADSQFRVRAVIPADSLGAFHGGDGPNREGSSSSTARSLARPSLDGTGTATLKVFRAERRSGRADRRIPRVTPPMPRAPGASAACPARPRWTPPAATQTTGIAASPASSTSTTSRPDLQAGCSGERPDGSIPGRCQTDFRQTCRGRASTSWSAHNGASVPMTFGGQAGIPTLTGREARRRRLRGSRLRGPFTKVSILSFTVMDKTNSNTTGSSAPGASSDLIRMDFAPSANLSIDGQPAIYW